MKKLYCGFALALLLISCAPSPHIAFTDQEGIKGGYQDPKLAALNTKYRASLKDIYSRFRLAGVDVYKEGIGFTKLSDRNGPVYHYLMVCVKPSEIAFDGNRTTPEQRLNAILQRHFENNLRYLNLRDIEKDEIQGVAFGIYWPVRDFNQCSKYGGFLEYVVVYLKKGDASAFLNRNVSLNEILRDAEIVTSQGLKDPVPIRLTDQ